MRNVKGIPLGDNEVKAWQDALGTPVLGVLGKMLTAIYQEAQETFEAPGAELSELKLAQGLVQACHRIEDMSAAISKVNLDEKEDEVLGDDEDDDGGDVDVCI